MSHKCPHCQKPIALRMKIELVTQQAFIDDLIENEGVDNNGGNRKEIPIGTKDTKENTEKV